MPCSISQGKRILDTRLCAFEVFFYMLKVCVSPLHFEAVEVVSHGFKRQLLLLRHVSSESVCCSFWWRLCINLKSINVCCVWGIPSLMLFATCHICIFSFQKLIMKLDPMLAESIVLVNSSTCDIYTLASKWAHSSKCTCENKCMMHWDCAMISWKMIWTSLGLIRETKNTQQFVGKYWRNATRGWDWYRTVCASMPSNHFMTVLVQPTLELAIKAGGSCSPCLQHNSRIVSSYAWLCDRNSSCSALSCCSSA